MIALGRIALHRLRRAFLPAPDLAEPLTLLVTERQTTATVAERASTAAVADRETSVDAAGAPIGLVVS